MTGPVPRSATHWKRRLRGGLSKGGHMLAMWVKVRVKPEQRERFLKAIEVDALGS